MKKIVLDIQSGIHAHNMERMLMQKLDDYNFGITGFDGRLVRNAQARRAVNGSQGILSLDIL